mmetsp:Transcript_119009/g.188480  ORF Transcript_119009/g.188480 Transcript_119009/m.188480 type:complete len:385 (-) Transcript_119009:129-1283(-)
MARKIAGRSKKTTSRKSQVSIRKRPASDLQDCSGYNQKKKCKSIMSALAGMDELSPKVRDMISGLVSHSLSIDHALPAPYRQAAVAMMDEALMSTEKRLEDELSEARRKADCAQEDLMTCEAAATDAETRLIDLKSLVAESKSAIKECSKSICASRHNLKALQAAQKASQVKLGMITAQVERLQNVENQAYQPLKESAAQGKKGIDQVHCIQKLGKDFGFHETLLESIPAVLRKDLDKRRTFDGFVMDQLEREFTKHCAAIGEKLKEGEEELQGHSIALQEATSNAVETGRTRDVCNKALAEALTAVSPSKKVLSMARQNARKFASDVKKFERDVAQAQARLDAFRSGALAAFQEFKKAASNPDSFTTSSIDTQVPASRQDLSF